MQQDVIYLQIMLVIHMQHDVLFVYHVCVQRNSTCGAPNVYSVCSTRRTGSLLRPTLVVSLPSLQVPAPPSPATSIESLTGADCCC